MVHSFGVGPISLAYGPTFKYLEHLWCRERRRCSAIKSGQESHRTSSGWLELLEEILLTFFYDICPTWLKLERVFNHQHHSNATIGFWSIFTTFKVDDLGFFWHSNGDASVDVLLHFLSIFLFIYLLIYFLLFFWLLVFEILQSYLFMIIFDPYPSVLPLHNVIRRQNLQEYFKGIFILVQCIYIHKKSVLTMEY